MTTDIVRVSIHSRNNRELPVTKGEIARINWSAKDRPQNAVKTLILWLSLCFCSIFVPIAHFFLVPSLFIAAFVLALDKLREEKRNAGGSGDCPQCHHTFVIEKSKWTDRLTDTCGNCHDDLEINIPQT